LKTGARFIGEEVAAEGNCGAQSEGKEALKEGKGEIKLI
jgi:hypothetical protein